ncbi:hypothetical protein HanIR_Chr02g0064701 [Helianthus annuus]|nr:hypothetical protein HanIR_Chr02g0064701 [Helianthus annuus]
MHKTKKQKTLIQIRVSHISFLSALRYRNMKLSSPDRVEFLLSSAAIDGSYLVKLAF